MEVEIQRLELIKEYLNDTDCFELNIYNKKENFVGVAIFCNNNDSIKIFHGKVDGSDDIIVNYKTFIDDYLYYVAHENEPDVPLHFEVDKKINI